MPKLFLECTDATINQWKLNACDINSSFDIDKEKCIQDDTMILTSKLDPITISSDPFYKVQINIEDTKPPLYNNNLITYETINYYIENGYTDFQAVWNHLMKLKTQDKYIYFIVDSKTRKPYIIGQIFSDAKKCIICSHKSSSFIVTMNQHLTWSINVPYEIYDTTQNKCRRLSNIDIQNVSIEHVNSIPYNALASSGWALSFDRSTQHFTLKQNIHFMEHHASKIIPTLESNKYYIWNNELKQFKLSISNTAFVIYNNEIYFMLNKFEDINNQLNNLISERFSIKPQIIWNNDQTMCATFIGNILLDLTIQQVNEKEEFKNIELNLYTQITNDFIFPPTWTTFLKKYPDKMFKYYSTQYIYTLPKTESQQIKIPTFSV